ncbi:neuronal tyrosine-phosphorylated phosphoinositide-3-kinase adapter 1 [Protopterus annectens]|uniref:neuronal tyrosine-phosphorylated phosphoinositide-3-kinase adapter 1 n=1 Tax=Protopterus annectens TaxID=7888 RepID=UPI001CF9CB71|nr:neuronal tyrosine-phosphorylated phosphoinositide-3-kinase adapter 1 [Protopterus annectens]
MMIAGTQDVATSSFLQFIEEKGIEVYNSLINASQSSRSSQCEDLRYDMNLLYRKSKLEWKHKEEESKKSTGKDVGVGKVRDIASFRKHFRMGFMTMPASQEHSPHPCASSMAPRSLSCHSVGSTENDEDHQSSTKKPPAKPKRHPATKLSMCEHTRAVGTQAQSGEGSEMQTSSQKSGVDSSDDGRRIPPLKPKRSPNTHLSVSFDEAYANRPSTMMGLGRLPRHNTADSAPQPRYNEDEEPVYIEMVGDIFKGQTTPDDDSEENEAIYEEMKYPLLEDFGEVRTNGVTSPVHEHMSIKALKEASKLQTSLLSKGSSCDIPPPFPNLLQHRPPLFGLPQPPSQKTYKPATVTTQQCSKLPVLQVNIPHLKESSVMSTTPEVPGSQRGEKDQVSTAQSLLCPSGRARSHSTPLPPHTTGQGKLSKELPNSHSMICPPGKITTHSLLPVPHTSGQQKDKTFSYSMMYTSVKATQSVLPVTVGSAEQKTEKETSLLYSMAASGSRSVTPCRPASIMSRSSTPHSLHEHCVSPVGALWTYPAAGLKRTPTYDGIKPGGIQKCCSVVPQTTVRTQVQDRGGLVDIACSHAGSNSEPRALSSPPEESLCNSGWTFQRKPSCSRKSRDPEKTTDDDAIWNSTTEAPAKADKEEKSSHGVSASGIPVRTTQGSDRSTAKGSGRTGLPVPCQTFPACHRSGEFGGAYRLGRSASTSGVRHPAVQIQRQCNHRESQNLQTPPPLPQIPQALKERDGKLLEVIEQKRCLCKEIKARRRPERSLCKQDSMPILPSWRKNTESRKTGTPPCRRQQTVLWDTAI